MLVDLVHKFERFAAQKPRFDDGKFKWSRVRSSIMFLISSRWFLSLLFISVGLICTANVCIAQDLTEADLAQGKEIQNLILEAKEAFLSRQMDKGADRIRLAQEKLIESSAAGKPILMERLKPSYTVIKKFRDILITKGYSFDPLPPYSSLLGNTAAMGVESIKQPTAEAIKELITMGGELFKQKRFEESADHIRDAQNQIVKLVSTSDAETSEKYKNDYRRIGKAQKLLTSKGFTFDPQPEFDTLIDSVDESLKDTESTPEATDTQLADTQGSGSLTNLGGLDPDTNNGGAGSVGSETEGAETEGAEAGGGNIIPLTGLDKIMADRKQVALEMFDILDSVHDNASAKTAVLKVNALGKRVEAIAKETGLLIIAGGSSVSNEFGQAVLAEEFEMQLMVAERKKANKKQLDLSNYPELKHAVLNMGRGFRNDARGNR